MTEIIKYIADDGTEFDDEQECVEYEFSCNAESMEGRVWLFDSRQRPLDLREYGSYEDAYYIFLADDNAYETLENLWPDFCCYFPRDLRGAKKGLWAFEEDFDHWYHMGDRIRALEAEADGCMIHINEGI